MNNVILPLIAATITIAANAPAYAETTIAPAAPTVVAKNVAAVGAREFAVVDSEATKVATLVRDGNTTYRLRVIGATTTAAPTARIPFKLDFTRALSPMQMNAVYDNEIDRVFNVTHSN